MHPSTNSILNLYFILMRCSFRTKIPSIPSKLFVNKDKNELFGRSSGQQHTFLSKAGDKKKTLFFTEKLDFNQQSYFYACTGYSVIVNTVENWILLPNTLCWKLKFRQICLGDKKVSLTEDTSRLLPVYHTHKVRDGQKLCNRLCVVACIM